MKRLLLALSLTALTLAAVGQAQPQTLPEIVLSPEQAQPVRSVDCDLTSTLHDVNHATVACGTLYTPTPTPLPTATPTPTSYLGTFDGAPSAPLDYAPPGWDLTIHSRDVTTWNALEQMEAVHGSACEPPMATHHLSGNHPSYVFQCANHLMTSLNATAYGVLYLTAPAMVDFRNGEAVIKWDMSTLRTSDRDWIDLWVGPYNDALKLPLDNWLPDLHGEPMNGLHVRLDAGSIFKFVATRNGVLAGLPSNCCQHYANFLVPDAARRDEFELRLTRTHIKFWMPFYNRSWINADIADLGWDIGAVQFGHHSYTPLKDCPAGQTCTPNTWHWDNVSINPSVPLAITRLSPRQVTANDSQIDFPAPALGDETLRFAAVGAVSVSFDGGANYLLAGKQPARTSAGHPEHSSSYAVSVPVGATSVRLRFANDSWYTGPFRAYDFSIWRP